MSVVPYKWSILPILHWIIMKSNSEKNEWKRSKLRWGSCYVRGGRRMRRNSHRGPSLWNIVSLSRHWRLLLEICVLWVIGYNGNKLSLRSGSSPTHTTGQMDVVWSELRKKNPHFSLSQTNQIINSLQLWVLIYQFTARSLALSVELSRVVNSKLVGNSVVCETFL